ncbi:MAG TPA: ribbon-helix-helix domain-containing protein [Spirochaetes bacterium]|nr:ribbon-helix-helix domain-containing protein [Spirochaetota bacterium]
MATKVLSTTIDEVLAKKLDQLAAETHRKKSYYVNQALKEYFEGIEDYELALQRKGGESVNLNQAKHELEL